MGQINMKYLNWQLLLRYIKNQSFNYFHLILFNRPCINDEFKRMVTYVEDEFILPRYISANTSLLYLCMYWRSRFKLAYTILRWNSTSQN